MAVGALVPLDTTPVVPAERPRSEQPLDLDSVAFPPLRSALLRFLGLRVGRLRQHYLPVTDLREGRGARYEACPY